MRELSDSRTRYNEAISRLNSAPRPSGNFFSKLFGKSKNKNRAENLRNCEARVNATREQLRQAQIRADENHRKGIEQNDRLLKTIRELSRLKVEHATQKEILEVMSKALKPLVELKENWTELFEFFRGMSATISIEMISPMTDFVEEARARGELRTDGTRVAKRLEEHLLGPANQAVNVATLTHFLSRTYSEVSSDHLMPLTSRVKHMLALDPARDRMEIQKEMAMLSVGAELTQERIAEIISRNRERCTKSIAKQQERAIQ